MTLESIFRETIARHRMFGTGDRVVAAVSGGADSTALVHLLVGLGRDLPLSVHVAHLDHGWRGRESDADRRFVERLAVRLGLPATCERLLEDPALLAAQGREGAARAARCAFLERTAADLGARRIATGHTRDDQAETVLLRLLRGAGARGLAGIPPVRDPYVRPLIGASRAQVEDWLRRRNIPWREDRSNRDLTLERNRLRHEILPLLERRFRSGLAERLAATADLLRDDEAFLGAEAEVHYRALAQPVPDGVALDAGALTAQAPALARRVLRLAFQRVRAAPEPPGRAVVARLLELARGPGAGPLDLPGGIRAAVAGERLVLRRRDGAIPGPFTAESGVPGRLDWPAAGISLNLQEVDRTAAYGDIRKGPKEVAFLDLERTGPRLGLRSRRAGDAFYPLGLGGRKKIQDLLVDARVPREDRDRVGLLTAGGGRIAWVVGHRVDERFKVTPSTRRLLVVRNEAG